MSKDTQANPLPADPILQTPLVIHTRSGVSSLDGPQVWQPSPQHPPPACPALRRPCSAKLEENPIPALSSPLTSKLRDTKPYNLKDTKARRHRSPSGLGHRTRRDHPTAASANRREESEVFKPTRALAAVRSTFLHRMDAHHLTLTTCKIN